MKILYIISTYWPAFQYGGIIQSTHALNRALSASNADITVYTTNAGLDGKVATNKEVVVDGIKVWYFKTTKLFDLITSSVWNPSWALTKALDKNICSFDFVLVSGVWGYPETAAPYFCRKHHVPYMVTPHGMLYPVVFQKKYFKKNIYYHIFSKKNLSLANMIRYTSKDELEKCHTYLKLTNEAIVVPNCMNMDAFTDLPRDMQFRKKYAISKDKKVLLFLGRISWKKGLDILIKAYADIARKRDDVLLVIAGPDGEKYEKFVKDWVAKEGIENKVLFTGLVTGGDKIDLYCDSDIFILPSYSENFGMSIVEAMACGLPVIVSDQVGISKEIQDAGSGIIIRNNTEELARSVHYLLDNKNICTDMGKKGKSLVKERFSPELVAGQMIAKMVEIKNKGMR